MNIHLVQKVIDMHSEDVFRGHLSNGCSICGPDNDVDYPCQTVQLLRKALESA